MRARVQLLLLLFLASATAAQIVPAVPNKPSADAIGTVVYDARIREFRCWSEGELQADARSHLCDQHFGWHPITANLYFVRGQSVSVLVANGVIADLFALDVKVDDLAEPTTPVAGALTDLPKLLPIPAAPILAAGANAAFVSTAVPVSSNVLYRHVLTDSDKDFKAWLQGAILDPLNAKEVTDLLAIDVNGAIDQSRKNSKTTLDNLLVIKDDLAKLGEPSEMEAWLIDAKALALIIDRENALRTGLVVTGTPTAAKTIADAINAARATPIQHALAINANDLVAVASVLGGVFKDAPFTHINHITVDAKKAIFISSDSTDKVVDPLLKNLNDALAGLHPAVVLSNVKANLATLADRNTDIQVANGRRIQLEELKKNLEGNRTAPDGVVTLQQLWQEVTVKTINYAALLNAKAKSIALGAPYDLLPVGQWYGSKTVTVTLKQGQRAPLFDLSGVSDTTRLGLATADVPAAKPTQPAPADLAAMRVLQFPIYNLYHFKFGIGFFYSTADDKRFQIDKVTSGSGSTATTELFIDQTRSRSYTFAPSANLVIFPSAQHAFPWRSRYAGEPAPHFYQDLGAMLGFGISGPNREVLLGGAWFPRTSPIGVQLAWHIGLRDVPPNGVDITQPITNHTVLLQQRRAYGIAFGLVFTTDFFGKVFAPIFKP